MKITAIMPVRNEEWILGLSARVALMWCDELLVLNHCSTDRSREILEDLARETGRVFVTDQSQPEWKEMHHRDSLLSMARHYGATHIALVDADEILCGDSLPLVREIARAMVPGYYLSSAMYCMWRGLDKYRSDPGSVWSNRKDLAVIVADKPSLTFQPTDGYQHHARVPKGARPDPRRSGIGVMHCQFADWRRLLAKHALYKIRERLDYPAKSVCEIDRMYSLAPDEKGLETTATPAAWLEPYRHLIAKHVSLGSDPWQEAEARRLFTKSPEQFAGLDLFGVCG